jgi:hypothetical protein
MRALIYNIRGFGEQGCQTELKNCKRGDQINLIGL